MPQIKGVNDLRRRLPSEYDSVCHPTYRQSNICGDAPYTPMDALISFDIVRKINDQPHYSVEYQAQDDRGRSDRRLLSPFNN